MSQIHTRFGNKSLLAAGEQVSDEQFAEEMKMLSFERSLKNNSRRNFLTGLAAAGAAAGALALTGCSDDGPVATTPTTPVSTTPSVFDVLNFALNLEYLEANFYLYIATGAGLPSTYTGTGTSTTGTGAGTVTGGAAINFTNPIVKSTAAQLATDEMEHVIFLRNTINAAGGTAVAQPALNLAALGAPTTDQGFVMLARQLETVGVSAYIGGAQYLTSNTAALLYAAQILDTEAQHEGLLRQLCISLGVQSPAVDGQDTPPSLSTIFNTSTTTGLNPSRSTSQVLQIVYGPTALGKLGISSGGFFPAGLNGTIHTS